jgi:hypothetical protein
MYMAPPAIAKKPEKKKMAKKGVEIDLGMTDEGLDSEYEKF